MLSDKRKRIKFTTGKLIIQEVLFKDRISLRTLHPSVKPLTSNGLIVSVSLKFFKRLHLT